jgi:hypothetical protein
MGATSRGFEQEGFSAHQIHREFVGSTAQLAFCIAASRTQFAGANSICRH